MTKQSLFQRFRQFVVCVGVALSGLVPGPALAEQVTVFAAASLKDALEAVADDFTQATAHDVSLSLAGSSALARQIQFGAPADIFISANPGWMDQLQAENLIDAGTRIDLLHNQLVLIAPQGAGTPLTIGRDTAFDQAPIAMALIDAVPAGIYGKAALQSLGKWDRVAPFVIQTDNVRAALALVALGEVPQGIVYATDALAEPRVSVIGKFPADSHPPIVYPAAILADRSTPAVAQFLAYLRSVEARAIFQHFGFSMAEG